MKKLKFLLASMVIILVTIIGCEKSSIEIEEMQAVQDEVLLKKNEAKAPKVTICHYDADLDKYHSITISTNAEEAHMAHGDKFSFSPQGEYVFEKVKENGKVAYYDVVIEPLDENGDFTGSGYRAEPNDKTYSVTILGNVNETGNMTLNIAQSKLTPEYIEFHNCWILKGTVSNCSGINFIEIDLEATENSDCHTHADEHDFSLSINPYPYY